MKTNIKTIDVQAKEWFDKVNGNSYFSATVTINYGLPSVITIELPFQYGYGDHYKEMAFEAIKKQVNKAILKKSDNRVSLWRFCEDYNIALRCSKKENCLKRELTQ